MAVEVRGPVVRLQAHEFGEMTKRKGERSEKVGGHTQHAQQRHQIWSARKQTLADAIRAPRRSFSLLIVSMCFLRREVLGQ